jgi:hypothetical protein
LPWPSLHALRLSLRAIVERLEVAGHVNSNGRRFCGGVGAEHAGVSLGAIAKIPTNPSFSLKTQD